MRYGAFLYGNIVLKSEREPTMEAIAARHEKDAASSFPGATFRRLQPLEREGWGGRDPEQTILRVGNVGPSYAGPEYSLYIDHPNGVLVLVLLCPEGQETTYVPLLTWVGQKALMMDCTQK